ncbi:hypothetical protein ATO8_09031 [Roseivivax marinus]|uniref:EamA domain-containing protein n=1 Tax=Roseivivax marinus TaxID=1379903 RepID=W4HKU0_9RHOB|nr:DMT family transporter [Roseivivax marinus]ETW13344.1 hypothetical protein ATO8_09031 [Roseivivax marinus]
MHHPAPPRPTATDWLSVVALGIVWGATFLVTELALAGVTPAWLAAGRVVTAAAVTAAIWRLAGSGRLFTTAARSPGGLAIVGAFSTAVPFLLLAWAQTHVTSAFAGVSMAAIALIVLPLSHLLLRDEALRLDRVAGLLVGFAGVALLLGGGALRATGDPLEPVGRLACIGAACSYAVASVTIRRLPPVDPLGLAATSLLIGSAVVVPLALLLEGPPALPDAVTLGWIVLLGVVPTAGANMLRVLVVRRAGPVFMSLTNYQVPVWSVIFGAVILGEPVRPGLFAATALILGGIALSQRRALAAIFARRRAG